MSDEPIDLSEFPCGELSPETSQPCVLRASDDAHQAGHESAYINNIRAVWATTGDEWWKRPEVAEHLGGRE